MGVSRPQTSASFVPGSYQVGYLLSALPFPTADCDVAIAALLGIRGHFESEPLILDIRTKLIELYPRPRLLRS
jgi:hypothetical protein